MRHWTQEEMVLRYYREDPGRADIGHLASCQVCRPQYEELERVLSEMTPYEAPARDEDYPAALWQNIRARLERPQPRSRRLPAWAAVAALIVAAFFLGRMAAPREAPRIVVAPAAVRDRVLMVALGEHLERSKIVLVELSNAPVRRSVDISGERQSAEDLLAANRLYRQTAAATGARAIEDLLEDLELLLVEVARGPARISPRDLAELRARIESRGLLFKLRMVESRLM